MLREWALLVLLVTVPILAAVCWPAAADMPRTRRYGRRFGR